MNKSQYRLIHPQDVVQFREEKITYFMKRNADPIIEKYRRNGLESNLLYIVEEAEKPLGEYDYSPQIIMIDVNGQSVEVNSSFFTKLDSSGTKN